MSILFIVESPGKIKKISGFLGKNYVVKASVGHFRDLDPKSMSIDFDNHFEPIYIITKADVVKNLKSAMKGIETVYLASDLDFEGEAISQSLYDVLRPKRYKRLRFNAITKEAIMEAIKNAGEIDGNLVNAQKTRRVLDRLFGYLISPILQKQLGGGGLSAGRVQSVAAKIVIDKENEIKNFLDKNSESSYFKVHGIFSKMKATLHQSADKKAYSQKEAYKGKVAQVPLADGDNPNSIVIALMKRCLKSVFVVQSVEDKIATRSPAPPFTTSTLQQEAHRKFGMSVDTTMKTAQKLYEGGYITYMRTDSLVISAEGHQDIKKVIEKEYGKEYYQKTDHKNKIANASNAHECIRPTHPELLSLEDEVDDKFEQKLYKLIWQRTIASQMKPARINVTTIQISISKLIEDKADPYYYFVSQIEKVIFPGFMKVYVESTDDASEEDSTKDFKGKIPKVGDKLDMDNIIAKQEYMKPPPRYTEASLVKKLEALGIGRPSTYVNTIKTIMAREYVKVDNVAGIKKDITTYTIKTENKKPVMKVFEEASTILLGKETKKIMPTPLGVTVNDFLVENFPEMMDYKFTAKMEEELDAIANGKKVWHKVINKFYERLQPIIDDLSKKKGVAAASERLLGTDGDGNEIYATKTKYGPAVKKQIDGKTYFATIAEPLKVDTIKLKEAVKLFAYPKVLGQHDGKDIVLQKGKFGMYITYNGQNCSLPRDSGEDITLKAAVKLIKEKKANNLGEFNVTERNKKVKVVVLKGPYGMYAQATRGKAKTNYPIPRNADASALTNEDILQIISAKKSTANQPKNAGSKTKKPTATKKPVQKKKAN